MIGLPTDFQHTVHIGSSDVELNNSAVTALQNQMQSKGGYETSYASVKAFWNIAQISTSFDCSYLDHFFMYDIGRTLYVVWSNLLYLVLMIIPAFLVYLMVRLQYVIFNNIFIV